MKMANNANNDPDEPIAPPKLVAALRRTQSAPVFVPRTVDEAVLRAARQQIAPEPTRRGRSLFRWFQLASLAACGIIALLVFWRGKTLQNETDVRDNLAQDINRDGQVDILDALQLAQEVKTGKNPGATDFNQDGFVDARDAEVIAVQVVKLEKGGRS